MIESKSERILAISCIVLAILVVAAYAYLLPMAQWADEYVAIKSFRDGGLHELWIRFRNWSPRPLSELVLFAYAKIVIATGHRLSVLIALPFWALLVVCVVAPGTRSLRSIVVCLGILALLFLGHQVGEVFYWPFAIVPYVATVAACCLIVTLDVGGRLEDHNSELIIIAALCVATLSSEVGALFSLIYIVISRVLDRRPAKDRPGLIFVPLVFALAVLYMQFSGRVSAANEVFGDKAIAHQPIKVVLELLKTTPFRLLRGDLQLSPFMSMAQGCGATLMLGAGVYLAMSGLRETSDGDAINRRRLSMALASIATAMLTLAASLYNFGTDCCARHDTMRHIYVLLAAVSVASYLAAKWPVKRNGFYPVFIMISIAVLLVTDYPKLRHDFKLRDDVIAANNKTWASGMQPGPSMTLFVADDRQIVANFNFSTPLGDFNKTNATGLNGWILHYFGKNNMHVTKYQSASVTQP